MNIAVIGGGASGMIAALEVAKGANTSVTLFEKNEKCGKKIYITGKGRCNLLNLCDRDVVMQNVVHNPKFLYPSLISFSPQDTYEYFESLGLALKVERGNRVFPLSDKSSDVISTLVNAMLKSGVKIAYRSEIIEVKAENSVFCVKTRDKSYLFDAVIIATGGLSYPLTGSTGDGYRFAQLAGHTLQPTVAALCELRTGAVCDVLNKQVTWSELPLLEGLSLKNVCLQATVNGKIIAEQFGEMMFTKNGVSGPIALTLSSLINRNIASGLRLRLDLKPALSEVQLDARLLREMDGNKNKYYKNLLQTLLPQKLIGWAVWLTRIAEERPVHQITKEERLRLLGFLKRLEFCSVTLSGYQNAVVTSGGVNVAEIVPKTMESKLIKNLFFVGEVLDIDALTGGFNLQIAMSTAFTAAKEIKRRAKDDPKNCN